jgi:hypothetical protein
MKNFNFIFFLLSTLFFSCSTHNRIHYRNEKKVQICKDAKTRNNNIAEQTEILKSDTIKFRDSISVFASTSSKEDLPLVNETTSERKTKNKSQFKQARKLKEQVKITISEQNVNAKTYQIRNPEKTKYRKLFDIFHWISIALFSSILILVMIGTELLLDNKQSSGFFIAAVIIYFMEFLLVIIQGTVISNQLDSRDKDRTYRRRLGFKTVAFILLLVELLICLMALAFYYSLSL